MKYLGCCLLAILLLCCVSCIETKPASNVVILQKICQADNLYKLHNFEKLTFTFNVQTPDRKVERSWIWYIKQNKYFLDGVEQQGMTASFINDIYWLLFPLKVYENRDDIMITVNPSVKSPITNTVCTEVVVKYVSGKGYTPNDVYKLYIDGQYHILEWAYLRSGQEPPKMMAVWKDYTDINGLRISLVREGTNNFRVWFTNVGVK